MQKEKQDTHLSNNRRLIKNTLMLYARMLLTVGISFYSTRLILTNLGIENYGIYNVIGGFVSMFYMVTSTMTQAISRYLTFELGVGNKERLKQTFSTSVNILLLLSIIVIILAETIGLWFINNKLNIPTGRIIAANWIYQFSILSFIIEIISVPYSASVIAHEKIGTFAILTILKVIFTLGIAILLSISPIDKLIFYGILVLFISILIQFIYWVYCKRNFPECQYSYNINKEIFKSMFNFAGWNFLTTCASMLSSQGVNIMLNMHFGTTINAAKGIASQVNGTIGAFSKNFTTALNPQITKAYAANDIEYVKDLVCRGAKFSYLLFFIIALPCIVEAEFLLSIWLKKVPDYSNIFVRLTLLNSLIDVLIGSSETLNRASGKIRSYQILVSSTQILILLSSYIIINVTESPIWTMATTNIFYFLIFIPRVIINKPFIGISFTVFFKNVLKGIIIMSTLSTIISFIPTFYIQDGWIRLLIVCILSTISIFISSFIFVLTEGEKNKLKQAIKTKILHKKASYS